MCITAPQQGGREHAVSGAAIKMNINVHRLPQNTRARRVALRRGRAMLDVFSHFMPKPFLERLGELIPGHPVLAAFPRIETLWSVDARRKLLDETDGLEQVLWLANPPIQLLAPPDESPDVARFATDGLAEVCPRPPDPFTA